MGFRRFLVGFRRLWRDLGGNGGIYKVLVGFSRFW